MKMTQFVGAAWLAIGAVAAISTAARADVPTTVAFTGALEDMNGPVDGPVDAVFRIYDAASGGSEIWTETHDGAIAVGGVLNVTLGSNTPLDDAVFDGAPYYLEVVIDGTTLSPRSAIGSVPYAQRATVADALDGFVPTDYQVRVTGTCPSGEAIGGINADGTVMCIPAGTGDITGVTANNGLIGGGTSGAVSIGVAVDGITTTRIANAAVTAAKIATGAVDTAEIALGAVQTFHIANGAVGTPHLASGAVTGQKINTAEVQARVVGTCASGQAMSAIDASGAVSCYSTNAYSNLSADGRLDNTNSLDLLTRGQADGRYVNGIATAYFSTVIADAAGGEVNTTTASSSYELCALVFTLIDWGGVCDIAPDASGNWVLTARNAPTISGSRADCRMVCLDID